jgi:hypothetical protein
MCLCSPGSLQVDAHPNNHDNGSWPGTCSPCLELIVEVHQPGGNRVQHLVVGLGQPARRFVVERRAVLGPRGEPPVVKHLVVEDGVQVVQHDALDHALVPPLALVVRTGVQRPVPEALPRLGPPFEPLAGSVDDPGWVIMRPRINKGESVGLWKADHEWENEYTNGGRFMESRPRIRKRIHEWGSVYGKPTTNKKTNTRMGVGLWKADHE